MRKSKTPQLPDTSSWLPNTEAADTLGAAFLNRCQAAEQRIQVRSRYEVSSNINNFDSGLGIEDIIRDEIASLLPARYATMCGVLNDSRGQTGGDYDIVIFNRDWVPVIKPPASSNSRRVHLPIEGVYAVGEVKQSLDYRTLDAAMRKLVIAHRLHRPPTSATRIVENRQLNDCRHGLTNPLYSFVIATGLGKGVTFDAMVRRFVEINQTLRRLHIVRVLCVLGFGTIHWVYQHCSGELRPASFMGDDLHEELSIGLETFDDLKSALYPFIRNLHTHLYHSVLAPEDLAAKYGPEDNTLKVPAPKENLTHSSHWRPAPPGSPWTVEWDPFDTGCVDAVLGAHISAEDDEEPE